LQDKLSTAAEKTPHKKLTHDGHVLGCVGQIEVLNFLKVGAQIITIKYIKVLMAMKLTFTKFEEITEDSH
jgi:hypothetical protein